MIRVAIVTNLLTCGGASRSLLRLGQGLVARGYAVTYITTGSSGEWFERPADFGAHVTHIPGHGRAYPPWQALRVGLHLRRARFDLVCFSTETYGLAALNLLPDRVPAVVMCRSDAPAAYRTNLINPRAWNVAVAVSPRVREVALAWAPGRPVVWIANGVEPMSPARLAARAPWSQPLRLLFVGRLVQAEKNILLLPAVLRACRERGLPATLTVAGDGPDRPALEAEIRRQGVGDGVRLLGRLSPDEVCGEMLAAHVLLLPSRFEGLPNVVLEAQACGCVPVAARLPGVTDAAMEADVTGLLADRAQATHYAELVMGLAADAGRWRDMSAAGPSWVAAHFAPDRMVSAYDQLIRDTLAGAYPLPRPRRPWQPVHGPAFTWRQWTPKSIRFWRHPLHHLARWRAARRPGGAS